MSSSQRAFGCPTSFIRRDAGNADAGAVQWSATCVVYHRETQCRVRYNGSCYSYLLERILKLRSSAPYTLQHLSSRAGQLQSTTLLAPSSISHHGLPSSGRFITCTLSLACTERYHGPLDRLTHLDKSTANQVEDVERTIRWVCVGNTC